ncbi:MAG: hypothetical protein ACREKL_09015 [Chthoniobacterales bacterium]
MDDSWVILGRWMKTDENGAREWLMQQPPGRAREKIISLQVIALTDGDKPEKALPWIQLMNSQRQRESAVVSMVAAWAATDPAAAAQFVKSQEDPGVRAMAQAGYVVGIAETDPAAAAQMITSSKDNPHAPSLVLPVLQRWINQDINGAAAWVATFPAGDVRNTAIEATMREWSENDPDASLTWLDHQMPAGAERDSLVESIARNLQEDSPVFAMKFAAALPNPKAREQLQESIARSWVDSSPVAAAAWIHSSSLPESVKSSLLAPPPSR